MLPIIIKFEFICTNAIKSAIVRQVFVKLILSTKNLSRFSSILVIKPKAALLKILVVFAD